MWLARSVGVSTVSELKAFHRIWSQDLVWKFKLLIMVWCMFTVDPLSSFSVKNPI